MTDAELIHLIETAWQGVPYPGDGKIFTPESHDDEGVVDYFAGTTWRGHAAADLRSHSSAFTFFTPEAFHYWLPAFMIAAVTDHEEADVIIECIPWSVCDSHALQRWPLFSEVQRQAVAAYLRFQIERFKDGVEDEHKALGILERTA